MELEDENQPTGLAWLNQLHRHQQEEREAYSRANPPNYYYGNARTFKVSMFLFVLLETLPKVWH